MLQSFPSTSDVVIIGGGVIGLSTAYHLTALGQSDVVVLEQSRIGRGTTCRSAGGVRHQLSSDLSIKMSTESIRFYERFADETGFDICFRQNGYLLLASSYDQLEQLERRVAKQQSLGVDVELLSPSEAQELIPGLAVDAIQGAAYCWRDGYTIPMRIVQGFAGKTRERGARILERVRALDIRCQSGRVKAVMTEQGTISAPIVVNCAGPQAYLVARMVGVDLPVTPHRRHIFSTLPFSAVPEESPMVVDLDEGYYFRKSQEGRVLLGGGLDDGPPTFHAEVPWASLGATLKRLTKLVPAFSEATVESGWVGLRAITPDGYPVLGPVSEVEGFICANGFSGKGVMHAPIVGQALAELILEGSTSVLDISSRSIDRFRE